MKQSNSAQPNSSKQIPTVLAVADGMIPSVELVLERPLKFLKERGELNYHLTMVEDAETKSLLNEADILILMRACMPNALELAELAVKQEIPIIYAIDDDFETLDPNTAIGKHYREAKAWPRLLKICEMSQQVWAFSQALYDKISPIQQNTVIPNAIASYEEIEAAAGRSVTIARNDGRKVIGYGATSNHKIDIDAISPAIRAVLDARPDVHLELVCVESDDLRGHPQVKFLPKQPSIDAYYDFVISRHWDIGIAPLIRSPANDAKTDNKFREFAAFGVPAVYADAPPYWRSVVDGYNGLVAGDLETWERAILELLDNPKLASDIAGNAREFIHEKYSLEAVSYSYLNYVRSALQETVRILVVGSAGPSLDQDISSPFRALAREGKISFEIKDQLGFSPSDFDDADMVVNLRHVEKPLVDAILKAKKENPIPLVFSWDDNFFVIPDSVGPVASHYRHPDNVEGLKNILRGADLVKASTGPLTAESRKYNDRVVTASFGFDFSYLTGVASGHQSQTNDKIIIGFFGGVSHAKGVEKLIPVLMKIAEEFPAVEFEFLGPKTELLATLPRVTFTAPIPDYQKALKYVKSRHWSIGLAPLEINDFNRAKLPTKFRDYGACHIAGVYTRLDPFEAVVDDGVSGILVGDDLREWDAALRKLIKDPALRESIAANAHATVLNKISIEVGVESWRKIIDELIPPNLGGVSDPAKLYKRLRHFEQKQKELKAQFDELRFAAESLVIAQFNGSQSSSVPVPALALGANSLKSRLHNAWAALRSNKPQHLIKQPSDDTTNGLALAAIQSEEAKAFVSKLIDQYAEVDRPVSELSQDLREHVFLEYGSVAVTDRNFEFRFPVSQVLPYLNGSIGLELVNSNAEIIFHSTLPLKHLSTGGIAAFEVKPDGRLKVGEEMRVRIFGRGLMLPTNVHLLFDKAGVSLAHEISAIPEG